MHKQLVLVVDDDESIRDMIEFALCGEGYEVMTAPDGQAALDLLPTCRPSLILLDMRMPVMDGWEFARNYRQGPWSPAPILVLTAAENAAERAAQIRAEGYLAKPFDLQDLFEVVAQHARV